MRRRQALATGTALLAGALAGCVHPPGVLTMDAADDEAIADEASLHARPDSEEYGIVVRGRENGTTTRRGRYELFDETDVVRVNDTFYEVSETPLERSEVTEYWVDLDFDPADATADIGQVTYEDLPDVDHEELGPAITRETPADGDWNDVSVRYGSIDAMGNDSVFVPEQQYDIIVYEGRQYRVDVKSRTAEGATYRYEVTETAPDVESYAAQVRERYLFALAGLSEAEREVVEMAIEDGYYEDDEAFRSVVDRLRDHEGFEVTDGYGRWLVEYGGAEYVTYAEW